MCSFRPLRAPRCYPLPDLTSALENTESLHSPNYPGRGGGQEDTSLTCEPAICELKGLTSHPSPLRHSLRPSCRGETAHRGLPTQAKGQRPLTLTDQDSNALKNSYYYDIICVSKVLPFPGEVMWGGGSSEVLLLIQKGLSQVKESKALSQGIYIK